MEEKKIKNAEAEAPKALDTEQLDQVAGGKKYDYPDPPATIEFEFLVYPTDFNP